MGIKASLGSFEDDINRRRNEIQARYSAAGRAAPAAAAAAAELIGEAIDVLRPYHYQRSDGHHGVRFWRLPAVAFEFEDHLPVLAKRLGRAWCIGTAWHGTQQMILTEDGTIAYASVAEVQTPGEVAPRPHHRSFSAAELEYETIELSAAEARWQLLHKLGLSMGARYFATAWDVKRMLNPHARQIVPLIQDGWDHGVPDPTFNGFNQAVQANQRARDRDNPAGYKFNSPDPILRPNLPAQSSISGLHFGVFDDGTPVLIHYNAGHTTDLGANIFECLVAWNLEKTLTQRIMCVIEERDSLRR
ncbi:hypothetical protein [Nocardia sp. NPDC049149]|uniref:hypothetical protein n=1 Tax=Nocardia sp. NPDC049149 TaxID=3364315 RepID=UPI00371A551F